MIGEDFSSRLTKYTPKNKDGRVVMEYTLVYMSVDTPIQTFLKALDDEAGTNCMGVFGDIEWSVVTYKPAVSNLKVSFGGIDYIASDLVGIKVTFKETDDHISYKYDLTFHKSLNSQVDTTMADNFLNRKEEDENGKLVYVNYDTSIKRY